MYKMHMNGRETFKFATRIMGESILQATEKAGLTLDDINLIVPHQANDRILQSAARHLKIDQARFISTIERYGNTSAASIPIALYEAIKAGRIKDDDYIAFVGFGGGLTWASMVVKWGKPQAEEGRKPISQQRRRIAYFLARWRARYLRYRRRLTGRINTSAGGGKSDNN